MTKRTPDGATSAEVFILSSVERASLETDTTDTAELRRRACLLREIVNRAKAQNNSHYMTLATNKLEDVEALLSPSIEDTDDKNPAAHPATIVLALASAATGATALGLSAYVVLNAMINLQASASAAFAAIPQASFAIAIYVLAATAVVAGIAALSVSVTSRRGTGCFADHGEDSIRLRPQGHESIAGPAE